MVGRRAQDTYLNRPSPSWREYNIYLPPHLVIRPLPGGAERMKILPPLVAGSLLALSYARPAAPGLSDHSDLAPPRPAATARPGRRVGATGADGRVGGVRPGPFSTLGRRRGAGRLRASARRLDLAPLAE